MKLSEIREAYERISGKLSDICRQLSLGGIGIIWIFKITDLDNTFKISDEVVWPLVFLVVTLILDLLQYFIQTIVWHSFYCDKKKKFKEDEEVNEPESLNIISWCLFYIKCATLIVSYVYLFNFLSHELI